MASVKIVLRRNKQKNDGTCPLAIRITKDRKARYLFTGYYIPEKDWDEEMHRVRKSHPNSTRLNNLLLKKIAEANNLLIEADTNNDRASSKEIKNKIRNTGKNISFFQLAENRIDNYRKKGTFSVANAEQSIVNNIKKFIKSQDLYFQDINVPFLERLKVHLISNGKSKRTVTNHLIFIRTMFNSAIKEGIVDIKYYPFAGDKIKIQIGSGHKIGLSRDEIQEIESLSLETGTYIWHTRNVWLFAFYFAGIRISDILKIKWSDFKDGRLIYTMNKNNKPVSLKIPEKAISILKHYQTEPNEQNTYVFPFLNKADQKDSLDIFRKSRTATKQFNKYLKRIATMAQINKNLSNHIARHSFGNIAGDQIHPLMLQKLYRHSDLKTTINYQANFIHKDADEALDKVVNF